MSLILSIDFSLVRLFCVCVVFLDTFLFATVCSCVFGLFTVLCDLLSPSFLRVVYSCNVWLRGWYDLHTAFMTITFVMTQNKKRPPFLGVHIGLIFHSSSFPQHVNAYLGSR